MHGPIDYIIVGFEGQKFDGSILKAVADAVDSGVIGLVGLAVIAKDADGVVTALDIADMGDSYAVDFVQAYAAELDGADQDDIDEIADLLENNTAAGLLVIEHLWAKPLKTAIINAGGVLVAEGRIHPEAAQEIDEKEGA